MAMVILPRPILDSAIVLAPKPLCKPHCCRTIVHLHTAFLNKWGLRGCAFVKISNFKVLKISNY